MIMVPDAIYQTGSRAERGVFDKLRDMALDPNSESYMAYHSLNITQHRYKRFAEIDFLICGPTGLFVLEIKGGGVSQQQGYWHYRNRLGEVTTSIEGPFRQAETALHALIEKLKSHLPSSIVEQFTLGYGVVFPDCRWQQSGVEWEQGLCQVKHTSTDISPICT